MKEKVRNVVFKCATLMASLAMVVAVGSVGSTCVILTHQPDLPEELK